jgi:four helix bundle protein
MRFVYDFEKLDVYQGAMDISEQIYRVTDKFPSTEMYGMTSQLRRAALSIALNIAEGKGRYHTKVYVQFLYQARGSLYETLALLEMARRLGYVSPDASQELLNRLDSVSSKLSALVKAISLKAGNKDS